MKKRVGLFVASVLAISMFPAVALPAANAASSKVKWTHAKVIRWVDGDTVVTTKGTIRLLGVDTPEVGRCGSTTATQIAERAAPVGSVVRLGNPRSVVDKDRYDRLLRYVVKKSSNVDVSAQQIRKGAKARYDSLDGYDWHTRQAKYRRLDGNHPDYSCGGSTTPATPAEAPHTIPAAPTAPTTNTWLERANQPLSATNPDINCGAIPNQYKPIRIYGSDYHRLDADHDGWGCDV